MDGLKRKLMNKLAPEAAALKTDWEVTRPPCLPRPGPVSGVATVRAGAQRQPHRSPLHQILESIRVQDISDRRGCGRLHCSARQPGGAQRGAGPAACERAGGARAGGRVPGLVLAAQLRPGHVPVPARALHAAQGGPQALPGAAAGKVLLRGARPAAAVPSRAVTSGGRTHSPASGSASRECSFAPLMRAARGKMVFASRLAASRVGSRVRLSVSAAPVSL